MIKAARRQHSGFTSFIIVTRKGPEQGSSGLFAFFEFYPGGSGEAERVVFPCVL